MSKNTSTRRQFLQTSASVTAAVATLGPSLYVSAAEKVSSDKLNIGIIGAGGRGGANLNGVKEENIYALCDTNPEVLAKVSATFAGAKTYTDWREVVQDPQIDAVVISTADHHHALCALAAMRAGKHVYCEKPLAATVQEARLMQEVYAQNKGKIATQMGTQIHATENYRRAVELVQSGAVGPVTEAHVWCSRTINPVEPAVLPEEAIPKGFDWNVWLGPAAMRPYNSQYWRGGNLNWNRRWEFGNGVLGDMGSHLIDLPFWALGLHRPTSVVSEGPAADEIACPPWQMVTWEHAARAGNENWAEPTKVIWYHGPEGMRRRSEYLQPLVGDVTKIDDWGIGVAFVGPKGVLVADYGKCVLGPKEKFADFQPPKPFIAPSIGHYNEWIQAAKTGGESLCNFNYSGALIEHNLLGNVAHRAGKKLEWDAANLTVTNSPEANALLTKEYRDGWGV
ncbi:Gfo/Idh/MocA family oxidoreductase [Blastopirellula sp. JC732]|uniref:Gfo/Idh/MocA family oxidoreductase n=1 Tax=Blastopirellula sediminis TaxID=2894196 RepID=A0A9X1MJD0_9BACT|nr:Gfo/Idh/MocA family oxidoreductase [Blastopirellula sediminis]MCC9607937.1 Gfo/Idh/MocA family oxidoreductase [Blastopirellula sediminis]MCC9627270.1 Gfo/Idh/MocA family oxidoreductase [Blastopirellula sediminis]